MWRRGPRIHQRRLTCPHSNFPSVEALPFWETQLPFSAFAILNRALRRPHGTEDKCRHLRSSPNTADNSSTQPPSASRPSISVGGRPLSDEDLCGWTAEEPQIDGMPTHRRSAFAIVQPRFALPLGGPHAMNESKYASYLTPPANPALHRWYRMHGGSVSGAGTADSRILGRFAG